MPVVVVDTSMCIFDALLDSACCTRYSYVQSSLTWGIKVASIYGSRWFQNFIFLTFSKMFHFPSLLTSFNCISANQVENFCILICLSLWSTLAVSHLSHNISLLVAGIKTLNSTSIILNNIAVLTLSLLKWLLVGRAFHLSLNSTTSRALSPSKSLALITNQCLTAFTHLFKYC